MEMEQEDIIQQAAQEGRGGDTVMAHLTLGEVVIPADIAADPEVQQVLAAIFQAYGADPAEFTVGDPTNKINPETGQPEFFFNGVKKLFKKIAPIALPILGAMIPGVGPVLGGAAGGAVGGAVSGGGVKGILAGAALGGAGGYLAGGGGSGLFGKAAGTTLDQVSGVAGAQGPTMGTGLKGILSRSPVSTSYMTPSNLLRAGGSIYGGIQEDEAAKKARNALTGSVQPYMDELAAGFDPGDLTNDPGYQFRLKQGQEALNSSLAARGMSQSGAAMKAAQEYGQGFAQQEYGNAYDRWLERNRRKTGVGAEIGNVNAQYIQGGAERKNKRIQEILAGLGYA